jgi:ectoine hydroxylase-related dioxygenase (phytanoyl-CoA dioxygenase family)
MHKVSYEILNKHDRPDSLREIDVDATESELASLQRDGYLLREQLFTGAALERLRTGVDRLVEKEWDQHRNKEIGERSWGIILRYLMDKDPVFLELLKFPPILSVAKAMLGPLIRLRGLSARVTFPGAERQETPLHQHLRVLTKPLPPWFAPPHRMDALIYLDDLNDDTGTVSLVPGSHAWVDRQPPKTYDPVEGELELRPKAGDAVLMHSNLWHRGGPTLAAKRRMLILSYQPTWFRGSPYGVQPADGLTKELLKEADEETKMLLGIGGYT